MIFAHGSRFGGHALFIKAKKPYYVYNFLGLKPEQKCVSPELQPGKYTLGLEFIKESAGRYGESLGHTKLYVNGKAVAEGPMRAQVGKFTLAGDGLCVGYDGADAVSEKYQAPWKFKGGKILGVGVTVEKTGIWTWRHGRRLPGTRITGCNSRKTGPTARDWRCRSRIRKHYYFILLR